MGSFFSRKKVAPARRPPLNTLEQVLKSDEGRRMIVYAIENAPPSTVFRWEKMLQIANRTIEPTEQEPDPIRLQITMDTLRQITNTWFEAETTPDTVDDVMLLREYLPQLYDKHSYERGRRVSQKERDETGLSDGCYAYGELDCEDFIRILFKIKKAFGLAPKGVFYDLGCGVGNLVFAACMVGSFRKVCGIDNVKALVDRGEKRMPRWQAFSDKFSKKMQDTLFDWVHDDFIAAEFWADATVVLLHWTAFSLEQRIAMAERIKQCAEGLIVIALTEPVPNPNLELLIQGTCKTSWGEAAYYIQEKTTPAGR